MFRRGSKPLSKRQISPLQTCVVPCGAGDWAAESLQQTCRKPRDLLTVSDAAGLEVGAPLSRAPKSHKNIDLGLGGQARGMVSGHPEDNNAARAIASALGACGVADPTHAVKRGAVRAQRAPSSSDPRETPFLSAAAARRIGGRRRKRKPGRAAGGCGNPTPISDSLHPCIAGLFSRTPWRWPSAFRARSGSE